MPADGRVRPLPPWAERDPLCATVAHLSPEATAAPGLVLGRPEVPPAPFYGERGRTEPAFG